MSSKAPRNRREWPWGPPLALKRAHRSDCENSVSPRTVQNWIKRDQVPFLELPGGEYRLPLAGGTAQRLTEGPDSAQDVSPAFSPDGRSLVVTTRSGAGRIWDVSGAVPRERAKLSNDDSSWVHLGGFDAAGQTFVTYGGPRLRRWELASGRLREEWAIPLGGGNWAYSPDRRHAAISAPVQSTVYILRLTTPSPN